MNVIKIKAIILNNDRLVLEVLSRFWDPVNSYLMKALPSEVWHITEVKWAMNAILGLLLL